MRLYTTIKRKAINHKKNSERLKVLSAILLVVCYGLGNVSFETFHQLFHTEKVTLHSTEQEKDPCHRALYHKEKDHGCKHTAHVASYKKCRLCENISVNDQLVNVCFTSVSYGCKPASNTALQPFAVITISSSLLPRAPPATIA